MKYFIIVTKQGFMKKIFALLALVLITGCQSDIKSTTPELEAKKANLRKLAEDAKKNNDFSSAAKLESQIVSLDVNDIDSFINLSKTLKKQGQKGEALSLLQTAEKLKPTDEKIQFEVAKSLIDNEKYSDAITKLQTIKTIRTKDYYNALGISYDATGQHKIAQETLKEGLKIAPNDGLLLNNLALSYILEMRYNEAIKILEELVKRPDALPKYRQNLALAYGFNSQGDKAYELLTKDLPEKEAKENLKFYKEYRSKK